VEFHGPEGIGAQLESDRASLTAGFVRLNLPFVETYEAVLEALGDRTRRRIVDVLRRSGPSSVAELAARLPVSRPAVSQHLTVLLRSRLVTYEESGTRNVYRLDPTGMGDLRAWMDGFWQEALGSYAEAARKDAASGRSKQHDDKKGTPDE
jgi:DNA-binding transcriptional ArsR family regulator